RLRRRDGPGRRPRWLGLPPRRVAALRGPQPRLHFLIVRRQLQRLLPALPRLVVPATVGVDASQLLQHRDRLGDLSELLERPGQHLQRAQVTGVALEADLQLRQRALRVAVAEVLLSQLLRNTDVALVEMADALRDAQVVVVAPV